MRSRLALAALAAFVTASSGATATAAPSGVLVFSSNRTGDSEVWSRDAASGALRRLTTSAGIDTQPVLSPDGRSIAFVSLRSGTRRIWTMRNDGADPRMITSGVGLERDPAFAPDGEHIAFVSDRSGADQIFTARVDGTDVRQLTSSAGNNAAPAYSPDGSRIAFVSNRTLGPDGEPASDIYMMRADGADQRNITSREGGEGAPVFTPDGTGVIYGRDIGGLWRQDLASGALAQLTDGPRDDDATLAPDGSLMAFSGTGPQVEGDEEYLPNYDVYSAPTAGGAATRLTTEVSRDVYPSWGPMPAGIPGEGCAGEPLTGRGGALGAAGHGAWFAGFSAEVCPDGPTVTFNDASTGPLTQGQGERGDIAGLRSLGWSDGWNTGGARHDHLRWAGTDLPPLSAQRQDMEDGVAGAGDDGKLRTIPVAVGAIAMLVNVPDGCTVPSGAQFRPAPDGTARMVTDEVSWEGAWAGEITTWGDLLPDIGGAGCASKPVRRVSPTGPSGASAAVKQWLATIAPERGWRALERSGGWPADSGGGAVIRTGDTPGAVPSAVLGTDGAIGFADLSAARAGGFMKTPGTTDDVYWVALNNGLGRLTDPQSYRDGYRFNDAARRGANCSKVTIRNVPAGDATAGDWSATTAIGTADGYPLCVVSYALAWDDACDVYGSSTQERGRAVTLRDFLGFVVDAGGQAANRSVDLGPLPTSLQATALSAVERLGWAIPGGSCG